MREGDLGHNRPAKPLEPGDDSLTKIGVPPIDDPLQFAPAPPNDEHDLGVEGGEELPQRPDGQSLDAAPLEARDRVMPDTDTVGHIHLAQAEAVTQRARSTADLQVMHREPSSQPSLTRR